MGPPIILLSKEGLSKPRPRPPSNPSLEEHREGAREDGLEGFCLKKKI